MITLNESAPVVVAFEYPDGFRDALHFANQAERDAWTPEMIEAECELRHAAWLAAINTPRPEPTAEEVQAQLDALVAQQEATQEQIVTLAPPEVVVPILEGQQLKLAEQLAILTEAAGRG